MAVPGRGRIISKPTLAVIKEALTILCSHATMDSLFEQYGFERNPRVGINNKWDRASAYLDHCNWSQPEVAVNLLGLLTHRLVQVDSSHPGIAGNEQARRITKVLEDREGIVWNDKQFILPASSALQHSGTAMQQFDLAAVNREIERVLSNVESDPDDTLTSAKCLVESACRHILADFSETPSSGAELNDLLKLVMGHLNLLPEQVSEKAKGADAIKRVLRSMVAACQGLVEVRNLYGDPHGKGPGYKGLQPRHARLAATLAGAVATFLMETHEQRKRR